MRNLIAFFSLLAAIALVLCAAPQVIEQCTILIADMEAYLAWLLESRLQSEDLAMLAEGTMNQ